MLDKEEIINIFAQKLEEAIEMNLSTSLEESKEEFEYALILTIKDLSERITRLESEIVKLSASNECLWDKVREIIEYLDPSQINPMEG